MCMVVLITPLLPIIIPETWFLHSLTQMLGWVGAVGGFPTLQLPLRLQLATPGLYVKVATWRAGSHLQSFLDKTQSVHSHILYIYITFIYIWHFYNWRTLFQNALSVNPKIDVTMPVPSLEITFWKSTLLNMYTYAYMKIMWKTLYQNKIFQLSIGLVSLFSGMALNVFWKRALRI